MGKGWRRLVRGKDRERESKEEKTEQRWEDQTSQQLSVEQGREVTTRRGAFWVSAAGEGGASGMAEELLDREGQREWQHTSFCYCVGEGEKDGGIVLMA